jgi:hypothetical protein
MLNPSTADAERDDPTIRRCIGFSQAWGFGSAEIVNLFALRATDPGVLRVHADPVGPETDDHILSAAARAEVVIAAWGAFGFATSRAEHVLSLLSNKRLHCLGRTRSGAPRHPLYLPKGARRRPFARVAPDATERAASVEIALSLR